MEKHYGGIGDRATFLRMERTFSEPQCAGYAENDKPDARKLGIEIRMGSMDMVDGGLSGPVSGPVQTSMFRFHSKTKKIRLFPVKGRNLLAILSPPIHFAWVRSSHLAVGMGVECSTAR